MCVLILQGFVQPDFQCVLSHVHGQCGKVSDAVARIGFLCITPDQGTIFIQYTDRSALKRDPVICANPVQPLIFRLLIQIAERYLKQRKAVGFIVLLYLRRIPFMICICFFS